MLDIISLVRMVEPHPEEAAHEQPEPGERVQAEPVYFVANGRQDRV